MSETSKRVTMADVFNRRAMEIKAQIAERAAWEATPAGKAWRTECDAGEARKQAADARYAVENPPDPFEDGKSAALRDEPREAPDDLSEEDADLWVSGWDVEGGA